MLGFCIRPLTLSVASQSSALPYLHSFPTRRSSDLERRKLVTGIYDALHEAYPFPDDVRIFLREWLIESVSQDGRLDSEPRSEEHTSELQSLRHLVCRLLLEKKKNHTV